MFESKAVIAIGLLCLISVPITDAKFVGRKLNNDSYAASSEPYYPAYSNETYSYSSYSYYTNPPYSNYSSSYYYNSANYSYYYYPSYTYSYYSTYSYFDYVYSQWRETKALVYTYTYPITSWYTNFNSTYSTWEYSSYVYYTTYTYSYIPQSYYSSYTYSYYYNYYNYYSSYFYPGQYYIPDQNYYGQKPRESRESKKGFIIGMAVGFPLMAVVSILCTLFIVFCCCMKMKNINGEKRLVCRKSVRTCTCCFRKSKKPTVPQFQQPYVVQQVAYPGQPGMQTMVMNPHVQVIPQQVMGVQPQQVMMQQPQQVMMQIHRQQPQQVIYAQQMQPQQQFASYPQPQQMIQQVHNMPIKTYQELNEEDSFRVTEEKL